MCLCTSSTIIIQGWSGVEVGWQDIVIAKSGGTIEMEHRVC